MKKLLFILILLSVSFGSCAQRNFAAKKLLIGGGFHCPDIGDSFQGGIVAYKFSPSDACYIAGCHGIIAMTTDLSTGAVWGCSGTNISTSQTICSGVSNTNNIISGCSTVGIAAELCYNYTDGTYSDWILPSQDELQRCILNIPSYFVSGVYYWSSHQVSSTQAVKLSTARITFDSKSSSLRVKAIRYF